MATKAPVKAPAKKAAKKAPAKKPRSPHKNRIPVQAAPSPDGSAGLEALGWSISEKPFRRVRGGELSAICLAVRRLPFETPVSSPAGQLQTITKYAREMGCLVQSVVDHEGPKSEEGVPLNRIWIKKDPNNGAIPDLA